MAGVRFAAAAEGGATGRIVLALNPDWVHLGQLTAGRHPDRVTLPDTPRNEASTHNPAHPLYAIHGQDPRTTASQGLGEKLVGEIVSRLAERVEACLAAARESVSAPAPSGRNRP